MTDDLFKSKFAKAKNDVIQIKSAKELIKIFGARPVPDERDAVIRFLDAAAPRQHFWVKRVLEEEKPIKFEPVRHRPPYGPQVLTRADGKRERISVGFGVAVREPVMRELTEQQREVIEWTNDQFGADAYSMCWTEGGYDNESGKYFGPQFQIWFTNEVNATVFRLRWG